MKNLTMFLLWFSATRLIFPVLLLNRNCVLPLTWSILMVRMYVFDQRGDFQNFEPTTGVRPVELFMCSISKKIGYSDGIVFLVFVIISFQLAF